MPGNWYASAFMDFKSQGADGRFPADPPLPLFEPIHGIVRKIDSQRQMRAQHMKKYVQATEIIN
jgi:hypothetical protein